MYMTVVALWDLKLYRDGGEWGLCLVRYDAVLIGEFLHFWMFEDGASNLCWNGRNCLPMNVALPSRKTSLLPLLLLSL